MVSGKSRTAIFTCYFLVLMSLALSGCAGTPAASATVTSSPMTAPTSTATQAAPSSEWQRYTDAKFGFRVEVASYLTKSGPDPFNYEGVKILFMSSGAEHGWEQAYIYVDPAPPQSLCTSALTGEKVSVGPGLTGYQRFREAVPPLGGGGGGADTPSGDIPYMELFVVASGVLMQFQLGGAPPATAYTARYGAQWQHLLATFVPGPPYAGAHACQ
jgi:hypothetical protein